MSNKDYTIKIKEKQYRHLTKEDCIIIETLVNIKDKNGKRIYSNTYIANYIGVHKSTITRELKRIKAKINIMNGKIKNKPYNAIDSQNDYMFKRALSKCHYKLEDYPIMKEFIENKILKERWAPDVIVGYMKKSNYFNHSGFCKITAQTIYNNIRLGILNIKIEDMRRMKYDSKYEYHEEKEIQENKREYSIEKRPSEINERLIFGHFELDTVIGKKAGKHECLMTLTERKTKYKIIFKLKTKTKEEVIKMFNKLKQFMKKNYDKMFKSLTTDNGSEMQGFIEIIKDTNFNLLDKSIFNNITNL